MFTPFHAKYFAYDLTRHAPPGAADQLSMSLFDASVDLNPHQIEAAMFALQSPLSEGVILADEVGLGKTIEAGIVLCQRWAERRRCLLVVCPASIRKQWATELIEKFNLPALVMPIPADHYEARVKTPGLKSFLALCAAWSGGFPTTERAPAMIKSYTDHAANERTFLAWLRTGVAVIAFGFLMERFDLFIVTMADAVEVTAAHRAQLDALAHSFSAGAGRGFILVGIAFILVATFRFVRTGYLLDDAAIHAPGMVADLSLSVILAVLLLIVTIPLILPLF